jgi:hypothetical protein
MAALDIFGQDRALIRGALAGLSAEATLAIPPGFDNNIAWNLGHIIVTQQALHYRLSGLPTATTRDDRAMFKTGSAPADWAEPPAMARLLGLLDQTTTALPRDYAAGVFSGFRAYTTSTGVGLHSFEDALAFNHFHEGLHLGMILALRNLVAPGVSY